MKAETNDAPEMGETDFSGNQSDDDDSLMDDCYSIKSLSFQLFDDAAGDDLESKQGDLDDDFDLMLTRYTTENESQYRAGSHFASNNSPRSTSSQFTYPMSTHSGNQNFTQAHISHTMMNSFEPNECWCCLGDVKCNPYSREFDQRAQNNMNFRRFDRYSQPQYPRNLNQRRWDRRGRFSKSDYHETRFNERYHHHQQSEPFYKEPSTFKIGVWGDTPVEQEHKNAYTPTYNPRLPLPFIGNFEIGVWNEAPFSENYRTKNGELMYCLMDSEYCRIEKEIERRNRFNLSNAAAHVSRECPPTHDSGQRRDGDSAYDTASTESSEDGKHRLDHIGHWNASIVKN